MAQQTVGPGIAENCVYGKIIKKVVCICYVCLDGTRSNENKEVESRDVEKAKANAPFKPTEFFFHDEIEILTTIDGVEVELSNVFFNVSETYNVE